MAMARDHHMIVHAAGVALKTAVRPNCGQAATTRQAPRSERLRLSYKTRHFEYSAAQPIEGWFINGGRVGPASGAFKRKYIQHRC